MRKKTQYHESREVQKSPELYRGIGDSVSWIHTEHFLDDYFKKQDRGARVLDVGCGNGYFLEYLQKIGFARIAGVDISNYLKDRRISHVCVDINVERLPYRDGDFDIITAFQVLEHLENYFLIIQEVRRVLVSGGIFIFSVPNQFNIFYRIKFALTGDMSGWTYENNHLLFLTRSVFRKTLLEHFNLTETYFNKGPVPILGRLNMLPGVRIPSQVQIMPRSEWFANRVCYVLKKK